MSYSERLERELSAIGISGALGKRIVAEIEDHLACDPGADLGEPKVIARQFADELGTRRALRAAGVAFAALAVAGVLFVVTLLAVRSLGGFVARVHQSESTLAVVGIGLSAVGAQVALIAGGLGCLRALRRWHAQVLSREEALVLVRRASVGLAAGLVTLVGLAFAAIGLQGHIAEWWTTLALSAAGAGTLALGAALPIVLAARRLRPLAQGAAGDLSDDLRGLLPVRLHAGSWSFAACVVCVLALGLTLVGIVQDDPYDGALRGLADGAACLFGYVALGRYLGLRTEA
jgi:hypothetical protein